MLHTETEDKCNWSKKLMTLVMKAVETTTIARIRLRSSTMVFTLGSSKGSGLESVYTPIALVVLL